MDKPKFLDRVRVKQFCESRKTTRPDIGNHHIICRKVFNYKNHKPEEVFYVVGTVVLQEGDTIYKGYDEGYGFKRTGHKQVFIVANNLGRRYKAALEDLEFVG